MSKFQGLFFVSAIMLSVTAALADEMTEGEKFYAQHRYTEAIRCFKDKMKSESMSAILHYNVANCYAALKNYSAAQAEYRIVVALEPNSKEAEYSKDALEKLSALLGQPAQHKPPAAAAQETSTSVSATTPATDDLRRGVATVSSQTNERSQAKITESERRAKEILDQVEEQCKRIKEEEKQVVDDMNVPTYTRYGQVRYPSAASINDAKSPFEDRMTALRSDAAKRAKEVLEEGKSAASYLEDSALDVDKSMIHSTPNAPVVVPKGSGLFIRNYMTPDTPSGNPLPLIAVPKALPPGKSKPK